MADKPIYEGSNFAWREIGTDLVLVNTISGQQYEITATSLEKQMFTSDGQRSGERPASQKGQ
jgi:hypothetical protein